VRRVPIKIRVALLAALTGALAATAVGAVTIRQTSGIRNSDFDALLGETADESYLAVQGGMTLSSFGHPGAVYGTHRVGLFDQTGNLLDATDPPPPPLPAGQPMSEFFTANDPDTGQEYRAVGIPVISAGRTDVLVVALHTAVLAERGRRLVLTVALFAAAFTVVAGLGAYLLTGLVLDPIERLRRSAEDLAGDPGGKRLDIPPADDEVRHLAETLNLVLERIDETMATQRTFLAEASHELRTPIARLRADIDLARRPIRTHEEIVAALAGFDDHADHLTSLADSLLGLLAPQRTSRSARPTGVDEILVDLRARAPNGESLHIDVTDDAGASIFTTDPSMLVGVLCNLLNNAVRHGAPPVEITVRRLDNRVEFAVRDHGRGIPVEFRDLVLAPFGRGPAPTSGTGLGLSVVSQFTTSQGGELVIEDAEPGCRMVLRLPVDSVPV